MSLRKIVKKSLPDAIDLLVDVATHIKNSRPVEGSYEEEEIPISGEALEEIARRELGGYMPEFDSPEDAGDFNIRLLDDVKRKAEELDLREAGLKEGYGHEAKSFEGQSDVDYCLECCNKHSQTASMLMTEALQRAESGGPGLPGVQEKVRAAVREITGFEDDTETVHNHAVMELNTMARALRKHIYSTKAEIGQASLEDLQGMKELVDNLVEASYLTREAEEGDCPECREAVGVGMGLTVAKALEMPGFDELEVKVRAQEIDANVALDQIIVHAEKRKDKDAVDYLKGVKELMNTPL